jgi:hypothetical protein
VTPNKNIVADKSGKTAIRILMDSPVSVDRASLPQ